MAAVVFMPMHSHGGCDGTDTDTQAVAQAMASVSTLKAWYETWLPMLTPKSCELWLPMLMPKSCCCCGIHADHGPAVADAPAVDQP